MSKTFLGPVLLPGTESAAVQADAYGRWNRQVEGFIG